MKLAAVKLVVRYEANVECSGEVANRDKKNGMAVITTFRELDAIGIDTLHQTHHSMAAELSTLR